ncbi:MAG: ATP synthase F1 subunit epsilon [Mariprofundaceae bacterium]|nr:ATP synthase F1 subunit epsilon [Mariprofundaceae bacterium]
MSGYLFALAEEEVYRGRAMRVITPSAAGELAIMPGHTPLLAVLRPGEIRIDCPDADDCTRCHSVNIIVFGGFLELQPDAVIVLADAVERAEDIDEAQARKAVEQARKMFTSPEKDKASRAFLDLELAIAQLRVVRRNSKHSLMKS